MLPVKANFIFCLFNVFVCFWGQSAEKSSLQFAIFNFGVKLQNILEIGLKKYGVIIQK